MDDQGRPVKWWAKLLFEPREHSVTEWRLGLAVAGLAGMFAWLIWWTFIPTLIYNTVIGIVNTISWVAGLFSGGGTPDEVAAPVLTPGPTSSPPPAPSPSPSPSPSPFPR
jgi:hypothetical protein